MVFQSVWQVAFLPHVNSKSMLSNLNSASKCLPGASRKTPRCRKMAQDVHKKTSWAQLGSKMLQDRAKMGLEASKMTQGCPRLAQEDPPWTELRPKMLHDRAKMGPPWAQLGTKKPKHRSKIGPGRDAVSSRQPCWPRYSFPDLQEELQDTELPSYLLSKGGWRHGA